MSVTNPTQKASQVRMKKSSKRDSNLSELGNQPADKELFWGLLEPEYFRANMFCRKLSRHAEDGDDLFQDALVLAMKGFVTLKDRDKFKPWLYQIMINCFKSRVRRPWYQKLISLSSEIELSLPGEDPRGQLKAKRWLDEAFKSLTPEAEAMVTLHELEGWSIEELAKLYSCSEGAIKAKLFRARGKLRKLLMQTSESKLRSDLPTEKKTGQSCDVLKPESN